MKKARFCITLLLLSLSALAVNAQTTATDFSGNDCAGVAHHLFAELDEGKVIVVAFVMPCSGCEDPSLKAFTSVQQYAASSGGRVVFYLADDDGLTSCSYLTDWGNSIGIAHVPTFSDPAFVGTQYGSPAMPKIVVLGGTDHHVYTIQDNTLDTTALKNAISAALGTTGLQPAAASPLVTTVIPNPATNKLFVNYTVRHQESVVASILDATGAVVASVTPGHQSVGNNQLTIDLDSKLRNGVYFLRLSTNTAVQTTQFIIAR